MDHLFSSVGMSIMTILVFSIEAVSLILMAALLFEYRHIHAKRIELLHSLGGKGVTHALWERRLLMAQYTMTTVIITGITLYLYIFQPHLI